MTAGRRRRFLLGVLVTAAVTLAAIAILHAPLARFLIVRSDVGHADAMVVLSGSSVYDERVRHAIAIATSGRAGSIVLTNDALRGGWSRRRQANLTSIERARDMFADAGISDDKLVPLMTPVNGTYDEALVVRNLLATEKARSLLVVTSPYHARRALWIFRRVLEPIGVRVGIDPVLPGQQSPQPEDWWRTTRGWYLVPLEYVKLAYYMLRHG